MGRKSKYTPETVEKILEALRLGATYELAAAYAGIHYDTFNEWLKSKSEFSDQVKRAEGAAAFGWLAKIEAAANDGNWQAAAWKLERRYPQLYGRPNAATLDANVGVTLRVEWTRDWRRGGNATIEQVNEAPNESSQPRLDAAGLPLLDLPDVGA